MSAFGDYMVRHAQFQPCLDALRNIIEPSCEFYTTSGGDKLPGRIRFRLNGVHTKPTQVGALRVFNPKNAREYLAPDELSLTIKSAYQTGSVPPSFENWDPKLHDYDASKNWIMCKLKADTHVVIEIGRAHV